MIHNARVRLAWWKHVKSYGQFSMQVSEEDYLLFCFFFFPVGYLSVVQIKLQTVTYNYTAINLSPLSSKALVYNADSMMDAY